MEKFNPRIEVHNDEGLTITVRPDNEKFSTLDRLDTELKLSFNDEDIEDDMSVKLKNNPIGKEELIQEVFMGQRPPVITYPRDGTIWNDGIIRYDLNIDEKWIDNSSLFLEISQDDFDSYILNEKLNIRSNEYTVNIENIFDKLLGAGAWFRLKLVLPNGVIMYSTTVHANTFSNFDFRIVRPSNGETLSDKIYVVSTYPEFVNKQLKCGISIHNYTQDDLVYNEEYTIPFKDITVEVGFNTQVTIYVYAKYKEYIRHDVQVDVLTPKAFIPINIVELVDYLNNGGDPFLVDTINLIDMSYFYSMLNDSTRSRDLSDMKYWNTCNVQNFSFAFGASNLTNPHGRKAFLRYDLRNASHFDYDISNWNTSSACTFRGAFLDATAFNQDISNWDMTNVYEVTEMFMGAASFNQPIGKWQLNVSDISRMFLYAYSFDQPINSWRLFVTKAVHTFSGNVPFNQPLDEWDFGACSDATGLFCYAYSYDQNLNNLSFYDCNVTGMFHDAYRMDFSKWPMFDSSCYGNPFDEVNYPDNID